MALILLGGPAVGSSPTGGSGIDVPTADARGAVVRTDTTGGTPARPRVGLVLGGGGARGAAHVGVIRVLEELRIPVDLVVGTSMGAIIGGLYATGHDADAMEALLASIDWTDTLRDNPRRSEQPMRRKEEDLELAVRYRLGLRKGGPVAPPGAIQGQRLQMLLRRVFLSAQHVRDFDDLVIPFRAVATDLDTGEAAVLGTGDLALAIRSSMSVPGVFAPVRIGDQVFIDGGVVDNVPVDVARALGVDVVIAVNVSGPLGDASELSSALGISLQATQILTLNRTRTMLEEISEDDILLHVDLGEMSGAEFERCLETIPPGEATARAAADRLSRLSVDASTYEAWRSHHRNLDPPDLEVAEVRVVGDGAPGAADLVAARIRQRPGEPFDVDRFEQDLDRLYGIGRFALIDYHLEPTDAGTALIVRPEDRSWGPTFIRFGMGFTDDFEGGREYRLTVETLTHGLDRRGRELRTRVDLGNPTGLRVEVYQPLDLRARWFLNVRAGGRQSEFDFVLDGSRVASYSIGMIEAAPFLGRNLGQSNEIRVGARFGHEWLTRRVGIPAFPDLDSGLAQLIAQYSHDTFDDFILPSSGMRIGVEAVVARERLGADADGTVVVGQVSRAFHVGEHCLLLGLSGGGLVDGELATGQEFFLGGQFRLSGYPNDAFVGSELALARLVYYNADVSGSNLIGTPLYYGFSVEAGDVGTDGDPIELDRPRCAGSVFAGFDTLLGPIFLGYGHAERGEGSLYFSLGPLFSFGREQLFGGP